MSRMITADCTDFDAIARSTSFIEPRISVDYMPYECASDYSVIQQVSTATAILERACEVPYPNLHERVIKLEKMSRTVPKKVIFNPPATIVFWVDNTKTVVKCRPEDTYDLRTGLVLCMLRRICWRKVYNAIVEMPITTSMEKNLYDYIMIQHFEGLKVYKEFLREWLPKDYYKNMIDIWEPKGKKEEEEEQKEK